MNGQTRTVSMPRLFENQASTRPQAVRKEQAPLSLRGQFLVLCAESALVLAVLGSILVFAL